MFQRDFLMWKRFVPGANHHTPISDHFKINGSVRKEDESNLEHNSL